ncbi:MAG: HIRAN domain-containing protein [bacterium]
MKVRTDFVTNSSSSSFVLDLTLKLKNGEEISLYDISDEDSDYSIICNANPRDLAMSKDINEMLKKISENINCEEEIEYFTDEILTQDIQISDISEIEIEGNTDYMYNEFYENYNYNLESGVYKFKYNGTKYDEVDGFFGGEISFDDRLSSLAENIISFNYDFNKKDNSVTYDVELKNISSEEDIINLKIDDEIYIKDLNGCLVISNEHNKIIANISPGIMSNLSELLQYKWVELIKSVVINEAKLDGKKFKLKIKNFVKVSPVFEITSEEYEDDYYNYRFYKTTDDFFKLIKASSEKQKTIIFVLEVMGTHIKSRSDQLENLNKNDKVILELQPDNQYDKNCIAVKNLEGNLLGYLPRDFVYHITPNINAEILTIESSIVNKVEPRSSLGSRAGKGNLYIKVELNINESIF